MLCLRFIKTSTSVNLFAAIVGPSVPSFLAVYLSRYSEQARVSRKQELLLNTSIRKEILEARKKYYEELSRKLDNLKKLIPPFEGRPTIKNPLLVGELDIDKVKDLIYDASINNHIEGFHNNEHAFSIKKLACFLEDGDKINPDAKRFEEEILSEARTLLQQYSSFILDKTTKNIGGKTYINSDNLTIVLINIWIELYKRGNITEQEFIERCFPKRPSISNLKNETIGNWTIETHNLKFRDELILTRTGNLLDNYDVLDIIRNLILNTSLKAKFKNLYDRVRCINEYIWEAEKIIDEIREKISSEVIKKFTIAVLIQKSPPLLHRA